MIQSIPKEYPHLINPMRPLPKILQEGLHLYGIKELSGEGSNPVILGWADEIGGWIADFYNTDGIPWCGLYVGVCAKRAGFPFDQRALSARQWIKWGKKADQPSLGDVMVFFRGNKGGHVGFYVGEDHTAFHILGGNQSDMVNIARISKSRLIGARRCRWNVAQPASVRPVWIDGAGELSENEQ